MVIGISATKTDERGVYAFEWLPPGSYRIEKDLPAGLRAPSDGVDSTVDLTDQDTTRIVCRDIRARPDGQVSGTASETSSLRSP
ncbi:MAG: hypothetical protein WCA38_10870 [Candidatus Acidiferrales bacterium]